MMTLVLLVILSIMGYTLTSKVAAMRHREQYIIDYQKARYACDSAIKYTLATLEDINSPKAISRPNEPDFSDLFSLDEQAYQDFLEQWKDWLIEKARERQDSNQSDADKFLGFLAKTRSKNAKDINEVNSLDIEESFAYMDDPNAVVYDLNDLGKLEVRGPYGPPWPLIKKPAEFTVGSTKVKVEINDENAKYPLALALLNDKETQKAAEASFMTFCAWSDINDVEAGYFLEQFAKINEIKPFKLDYGDQTVTGKKVVVAEPKRTARGRRNKAAKQTIAEKKTIAAESHTAAFAKLFHSSLIDRELLARPIVLSDERKESALKFLDTWGATKVNVNSAPRNVLEAVFSFGGDSVDIADGIIAARRIKPFDDIGDLRKRLFQYTGSITKCEPYITTKSSFFTIEVTAESGVAKASAVIAIINDGTKPRKIAVISD